MAEADVAGIEARPGVTTLPAHYRAFIRDYPAALWEAGFSCTTGGWRPRGSLTIFTGNAHDC